MSGALSAEADLPVQRSRQRFQTSSKPVRLSVGPIRSGQAAMGQFRSNVERPHLQSAARKQAGANLPITDFPGKYETEIVSDQRRTSNMSNGCARMLRAWNGASFSPRNHTCLARRIEGQPLLTDFLEQRAGQFTVDDAGGIVRLGAAQVRAWPCEAIGLSDDDPGPCVVETKAALGGGRNLDPVGGVVRRRMRDRQGDDDPVAGITLTVSRTAQGRSLLPSSWPR